MSVVVVLGGQWGDEGKGKIVDLLARDASFVVRYQGGANAGHTVINDKGTFKMHLVPSGMFHPDTTCVLGNGVVIDPRVLLEEIASLRQSGIDVSRLRISDRAHVIMPYHFLFDRLEEEQRGLAKVGTTARGIGPAYADKIARFGIRVGDLLDEETFLPKLTTVLDLKNRILTQVYGESALSLHELYIEYLEYGRQLAPYVTSTHLLLQNAVADGQNVLLEGAQGTLLDLDFGTYPYVTSSTPLSAGASSGSGVPPTRIDTVIGVLKAYCTRVGSGPMPTEEANEIGELMRVRGHEYGTTTGRARRCGWFDAVAAREVVALNGIGQLAITKLDVLDTLPSIKICVGYRVNEATYTSTPSSLGTYAAAEPIYEELPGWQQPTAGCRQMSELPALARSYLDRLSGLVGCPINMVSVGPERDATIVLQPVFQQRVTC